MPDTNGTARLDRIERSLELLIADHVQLQDQHKQLLTAQVVLTDRLDRLTANVDRLTTNVAEIADKLNGLIGYLEGMQRPPAQ